MAFLSPRFVFSRGGLSRLLRVRSSSNTCCWGNQSRRLSNAPFQPPIENYSNAILSQQTPESYPDDGIQSLNNLVDQMSQQKKNEKMPHLPLHLKNNASEEKLKRLNLAEEVTGLNPVFLRDSCTCSQCRDPSSKQKNFQTTDIPAGIKARSAKTLENGDVEIHWKNDIRGFADNHVSTFTKEFLRQHQDSLSVLRSTFEPTAFRWHWNAAEIENHLGVLEYDDYVNDEWILYKALYYLNVHGLLIIKGVPESEKSVEIIGNRIGTLRDSFYGRTWDVKSVPDAKNVAYTHQFLGLHMDLLYMANPPNIQLLHCLKNTCEGGTSLFSDSFNAAQSLDLDDFKILADANYEIPYHYNNDGQHYRFRHRVIEAEKGLRRGGRGKVNYINYSPPFQAPFEISKTSNPFWLGTFLPALRNFARLAERPDNLFHYRLKEGECVVFNNRRVLHGRTAFDAQGGERWLKGTYVDSDVFDSRWRVLHEKFGGKSARRVLGPAVGPWIQKVET